MAKNNTQTNEETIVVVNNDEFNKAIEEKDKELNDLKDKLNEANSKFEEIESLKQMILDMQNKTAIPNTIVAEKLVTSTYNEDTVKIGSCLIGRHILCDNNGSEILEFDDIGDIASISTRLLDGLMTSKNKSLFKDGLIYFIDDIWYDRYSIKKNSALSMDTIDNIYSLPVGDMVKEINKLTNDGRNDKVKYSLYWAIVKNIASGKEGYSDKNKEMTVGSLFNVDINNSIGQLSYCKEIGFF